MAIYGQLTDEEVAAKAERISSVYGAARARMAVEHGECGDVVHLNADDVRKLAELDPEGWPERKLRYFLNELGEES